MYDFIAQTVFVNKSTYKDLIDELILSASKSNFYFRVDSSKDFDNSDSKISVDFTIPGKSIEELNKKINITDNSKWWEKIVLSVHWFVGSGQYKYKIKDINPFTTIVMEEKNSQTELYLYISKLREAMIQGLNKYESKTKLGSTYGKLNEELEIEIDRLAKSIVKSNKIPVVTIKLQPFYRSQSNEFDVITAVDLAYNRYYGASIQFIVHVPDTLELPKLSFFFFHISVKK